MGAAFSAVPDPPACGGRRAALPTFRFTKERTMKDEEIRELLYQALETELGGV
jgi:hypothetical protein